MSAPGLAPAAVVVAAFAVGCTAAGEQATPGEPDREPARPSGNRPDYELVFDPTVVRTYHLTFEPDAWRSLQDQWTRDVRATLSVGDEVYRDVAVRYKGAVSLDYAGEKKSLVIDFDDFVPDRLFHGLERIKLHNGFKDPSSMRENLAYALHEAAGDLASRTSYARVEISVQGVYEREYFGLYVNVEPVDRRYVRDRLGDDEGTLYEGGDFNYWGSDWAEYAEEYEPKTNESSNDHSALLRFLRVLDTTPIDDLGPALERVFDVDRFLGWLAANTLIANLDGIPAGGGNCYVYHDVGRDKMVLIPWDMNESFGTESEGPTAEEVLNLDVHAPYVYPTTLITRVLEVPELRERYDDRLRELLASDFSEAAVGARIDAQRALIREHIAVDTRRDYTLEQFDRSLDEDVPALPVPPYEPGEVVIGLRRFVRERAASVATQLD